MTTHHSQLRGVEVRGNRMRSANVEHDAQASLHGYIITGRGHELLRRVIDAALDTSATRAWAVTGPYGAGKSSFALLLTALLCRSDTGHEQAMSLLGSADHRLADRVAELTEPGPVLRAAATARKEPVSVTLTRALHSAAHSDPTLRTRLGEEQDVLPAERLLSLVTEVTERRPMLVVVDEFGKNLEYFAEDPSDGDVYLLQELAELAAGARTAHPLTLVTLQHATYGDYLSGTDTLQRREWSKVQGRFIDVSFTEDAADVAALVRGTIERDLSPRGTKALAVYASHTQTSWESLGMTAIMAGDSGLWADTYPVHPLVLAALPELCATLGQHDRTLTGFLTADEPHTLARFLEQHPAAAAPAVLATLRLDTVYDYFDATVVGFTGRSGSRWLEITSRVEAARDLPELDADDLALIKTVGLLNITGSGGALRASAGVLALALTDPQRSTEDHQETVLSRCAKLIERGFLTYRRHDDEYRVWAGTDVDIDARVSELRDQISGPDITSYLNREYLPSAVVAGRHSQENGILRYFQPVIHSPGVPLAPPVAAAGTSPDGMLVYQLEGTNPVTSDMAERPGSPLLIGTTTAASSVRRAAAEALALTELIDTPDLDRVARAEARDRLSSARATLARTLNDAFDPNSVASQWTLLLADSDAPREMPPTPSLSALVSTACDAAYSQSPRIRSEMLGRHQLTSQGAKARRQVLNALLEHNSEPQAGLMGNGPDMAIYKGVVAYLELHGPHPGTRKTHGWTEPTANSPGRALPAFQRLRELIHTSRGGVNLTEVAHEMASPPYGIKAGLLPLLLTAVIAQDSEIAIFDEGTFQSLLTPELLERMIKGPARFQLRHLATGKGQPAALITALADTLDLHSLRVRPRTRNPGMVLVAAALVGQYRELSVYAQHTENLSQAAIALRSCLSEARDPGTLVMRDLPAVAGAAPIDATDSADPDKARRIAQSIKAALQELLDADRVLNQRIVRDLGRPLAPPSHEAPQVRAALAELGHGITSVPKDPVQRGLVHHARQDSLEDDEWFAQAGMIITGQPPSHWRKEQVEAFATQARQLVRALDRLFALHLEDRLDDQVRRLTLTQPDGTEDHLVLRPADADPDVDAFLETLLAQARVNLGPEAERRLLGALAARTLTPTVS